MNLSTVLVLMLSTLSVTEGGCVAELDVAFVFDTSTSIEPASFESSKEYARQIVSKLDIGPDKSRVCLVHFSKYAYVDFDFMKYNSSSDIQRAILATNYTEGISEIDQGLGLAAAELLSKEAGARSSVAKFLIVFTDGDFTAGDIARFLSNSNVEINVMAVASGVKICKGAMKSLVKDDKEDVFNADDSPKSVVERMRNVAKEYCSSMGY